MAALDVRNLVKRYRAGIRGCSAGVDALRGVDLCAYDGEIVGVVGAPGSGKSTLLLCASGALRPDGGTISWFASECATPCRAQGIAYVPESALHYPFLTVREVLEHHGRLHALLPDELSVRISAVFRMSTLERWSGVRMSAVASGVARRVAIAQALIGRPRLLLLDEPFAGIDSGSQAAIADLLCAVARQGPAVVFATRDVRAAARCAARIVVMSVGRVHGEADPARFQVAHRVAEG